MINALNGGPDRPALARRDVRRAKRLGCDGYAAHGSARPDIQMYVLTSADNTLQQSSKSDAVSLSPNMNE